MRNVPIYLLLVGVLMFVSGIFMQNFDLLLLGSVLAVAGAILRATVLKPEGRPPASL